jgi:polysaccharide deacetylase family protein (PEP-CTERM system associated)
MPTLFFFPRSLENDVETIKDVFPGMLNAVTIDVEDWYHTNGLGIDARTWGNLEDRIVPNTMRILRILEEYKVYGTFFILGCVAEKHPDLVQEIQRRGHEVGSHGGWHQLIYKQTIEEFKQDLFYSKRVLEEITGEPIRLFRAPSWSISLDQLEVLNILQEAGFVIDSSIQPFATYLSGVKGAPCQPYYPIIGKRQLHLIEFPPSVWRLRRWTVPFSGGFYLRALPYKLIRTFLRKVNQTGPGMIYLHPWEFDLDQPRVKAYPLTRFIQYYNLHTTEEKFRMLLRDFQFAPISTVLAQGNFPSLPLER